MKDEVQILKSRSEATSVTPMMKQYLEVRAEYEGYIMLYRLGDFYECFFEDAVTVSRELELTLTSRDCGEGKRAAMCGVPFHKSDVYIGRLVERGFKVAVCEQVEDPKAAQGLVKREVVKVVTPGTVTDTGLLSETENNYLSSVFFGTSGAGLAFIDISTGEVALTYLDGTGAELLSLLNNEFSVYRPVEAIFNENSELEAPLTERYGTVISDVPKTAYDYNAARNRIRTVFGDEGERIPNPECINALGSLLYYIATTQKTDVTYVREINVYSGSQSLELDAATRRNLELVESMRTKDKRGSLLWVLDKTKTAVGARLLRSWVLKPLVNPALITQRQSAVGAFEKNFKLRETVGEALSGMLDIERLSAKVVYGSSCAKELRSIYQSIIELPALKEAISGETAESIKQIYKELDTLDDLAELLGAAIVDTPPLTVREGGMIRDGFNQDVDYYRSIKNGGEDIMHAIEEREKEQTGIRTLKVSYNKVFGYYIEVSKSFVDQVPDRYIRKQTLTNCERYITQELKDMESTIFSADERLAALEYDIFQSLVGVISENAERIRRTATHIANIDVYRSLGEVASRYGYVCPDIDLSTVIEIKDGRHPVVERFVTDSYFVPNDTLLDTASNKVMMITGPNMAGKSTYMRQVAIITIMAQIGSFVPARSAHIGIVDKVFTRVGASDDLASGQSTFMLEMTEVAAILRGATSRSLIIYDEVGRGTSTFDGMAIARAVVEYTHSKKIGAKTLFATHYHELTAMESEFDGIVNYNVAAKKRGDGVTFLRKIVRGGTDDSYGIEVAKLAGVPSEVVKRARVILDEIESGAVAYAPQKAAKTEPEFDLFSTLVSQKDSEAADRIRSLDINTLTPIEAMNVLFELKNHLRTNKERKNGKN